MKIRFLCLIIASVGSAFASASSEPFVVVDGTINDRNVVIDSFELGDVDGDGIDEVIYLSSEKKLEVVSYSKPLDSNWTTEYTNTSWVLDNHPYNDKSINYYLIIHGPTKSAYLKFDGRLSSPIPLEEKDGIISGVDGENSIYIDKSTDSIIRGYIKDSRIDTNKFSLPTKFLARRSFKS